MSKIHYFRQLDIIRAFELYGRDILEMTHDRALYSAILKLPSEITWNDLIELFGMPMLEKMRPNNLRYDEVWHKIEEEWIWTRNHPESKMQSSQTKHL